MILYQGPSQLTGAPVVAIATGTRRPSQNPKTGPMVQVWIIRSDRPPHDAVKDGSDAAICGDCPLRHASGGACYVRPSDAPLAVYRAYRRAAYPRVPRTRLHLALDGASVRLGAYGDPAAVPLHIWRPLLASAASHTGYTHQWRTTPELRPYVMASVESLAEAREAQQQGWRTFRVRPRDTLPEPGEIQCPAAIESPHSATCATCLLCAGARTKAPSITIQAHGSRARSIQCT